VKGGETEKNESQSKTREKIIASGSDKPVIDNPVLDP